MTSICRSYEYELWWLSSGLAYTVTTFWRKQICWNWTLICDYYMGIRYHCLLVCLWRRFNEPCNGFCLKSFLVNWQSLNSSIAIAEMIGAFLGALIAYFMYADHFKISEGQIDGVAIRNIFSTNPNCRNLPRNYFVKSVRNIYLLDIYHGCWTCQRSNASIHCWFDRLGYRYGSWWYYRTRWTKRVTLDLVSLKILPIKDSKQRLAIWSSCTRYCSICWCCRLPSSSSVTSMVM